MREDPVSHECVILLVQESQVLIRSRGGRKRSLSENWLEHKPSTTVDNGERRKLKIRLCLSGQDK